MPGLPGTQRVLAHVNVTATPKGLASPPLSSLRAQTQEGKDTTGREHSRGGSCPSRFQLPLPGAMACGLARDLPAVPLAPARPPGAKMS